MAEFLIKLADERGHISEQVGNARSEAEIRQRFDSQGLLVVSVKRRAFADSGELKLPARRRVGLSQFVVFNQQLITLIRAGLPILNSLDLLMKQQKNAFFRSLLQDVRERVKGGELLSEAFEHQGAFPKLYSTTLLAGEKSGNMEEVLSRYVHFQRLALTFRKKLLASLIYPSLLVVMVVVMLTFLITFVVPRFADLYTQLGGQLPVVTQFMLQLGLGAQKYFPVVIIAVVAIVVFLLRWRRTASGAAQLDRLRLSLPLLGSIWLKYEVSMFARMLSTLLAGGLPLVPALETASASMQSRTMANAIKVSAQCVREGQPLARSLSETREFPPLAVEMIEVGESTGALPQMLASAAEFFEEDVETALSAALALIEPAILIVMAGVVGFVLISLYLPIFKLGSVIH